MKMIIGMLMLACVGMAQTYTFNITPGVCQNSVQPPSYLCQGYMTDTNSNVGEWSLDVVVNSDNSITKFSLDTYFSGMYLNTQTINGMFANNSFSGNVSGYVSSDTGKISGKTFTASYDKLMLGTIRCGGYKLAVRYCKAIVNGTIVVTVK
jgi:hypothetical protein